MPKDKRRVGGLASEKRAWNCVIPLPMKRNNFAFIEISATKIGDQLQFVHYVQSCDTNTPLDSSYPEKFALWEGGYTQERYN